MNRHYTWKNLNLLQGWFKEYSGQGECIVAQKEADGRRILHASPIQHLKIEGSGSQAEVVVTYHVLFRRIVAPNGTTAHPSTWEEVPLPDHEGEHRFGFRWFYNNGQRIKIALAEPDHYVWISPLTDPRELDLFRDSIAVLIQKQALGRDSRFARLKKQFGFG